MSPRESVGYYRELEYWYSAPNIRHTPLTRASCSRLCVVQVHYLDLVRKNWDGKPSIPLDQHEQTPEILYLIADCSAGILRQVSLHRADEPDGSAPHPRPGSINHTISFPSHCHQYSAWTTQRKDISLTLRISRSARFRLHRPGARSILITLLNALSTITQREGKILCVLLPVGCSLPVALWLSGAGFVSTHRSPLPRISPLSIPTHVRTIVK